MRTILGITEELSKALQKKDQDIVNAMDLVRVCKLRLQMLRNNGWDSLLDEAFAFCQKNDIGVPQMDVIYTECRKWEKFSASDKLASLLRGVIHCCHRYDS